MSALEPERVYLKAPELFQTAQRLGYWKDVDVGKGAAPEVCPGNRRRRDLLLTSFNLSRLSDTDQAI